MKSLGTVLSNKMNCNRLESFGAYLQELNIELYTLHMYYIHENMCATIIVELYSRIYLFWSSNVDVCFSLLPVIKDMAITVAGLS